MLEQGRNPALKKTEEIQTLLSRIYQKLKIMPVERTSMIPGKTADFYFREATQHKIRGELDKAILKLEQGMRVKPSHFLCRFNHAAFNFQNGNYEIALNTF